MGGGDPRYTVQVRKLQLNIAYLPVGTSDSHYNRQPLNGSNDRVSVAKIAYLDTLFFCMFSLEFVDRQLLNCWSNPPLDLRSYATCNHLLCKHCWDSNRGHFLGPM